MLPSCVRYGELQRSNFRRDWGDVIIIQLIRGEKYEPTVPETIKKYLIYSLIFVDKNVYTVKTKKINH